MARTFTPKDQALLDAMPPPEEEPNPYLKSIIYGDAGRHKTVTSCSIGKTLLLAADPGWVSVHNHPDIWKNTTVMPFKGFRQLETLALAFYHQIAPYDQYNTFVVDTIAKIQESYVDDLLRAGKFTKGKYGTDSRPQFEATDPALAKQLLVTELPGMDDFHAAKNILRGPVTTLAQAPVNVIFLAHESEPQKQQNTQNSDFYRMFRPDVTEALYKIIYRDAHLVGRTTKSKDGKQRIIDFNGSDKQAGKSRIASLNDKKINAEDFPKYIHRWQSKFDNGKYANWEPPSFEIVE